MDESSFSRPPFTDLKHLLPAQLALFLLGLGHVFPVSYYSHCLMILIICFRFDSLCCSPASRFQRAVSRRSQSHRLSLCSHSLFAFLAGTSRSSSWPLLCALFSDPTARICQSRRQGGEIFAYAVGAGRALPDWSCLVSQHLLSPGFPPRYRALCKARSCNCFKRFCGLFYFALTWIASTARTAFLHFSCINPYATSSYDFIIHYDWDWQGLDGWDGALCSLNCGRAAGRDSSHWFLPSIFPTKYNSVSPHQKVWRLG